MEEKTFNIFGMKCAHCKASVEETLRNIEGVSNAYADLNKKTVTIVYDSQKVSTSQLKQAVANCGNFELETD